MIDDLLVGKTAAFYAVRRKLTARTIDELFNAFRDSHVSASKNIFRHAHEARGNSRWSAICFTYASQPAFLGQNTKVLERLCGYFMLVEYRDHVAVFSSRLSLPSSFKSNHLLPVAVSLVEAAIAKQGAIFQKLRLRNMSVSQHTMRSKTLEAADLSNVVGPSGSRRYVPQGYAVALAGVHTTATPSTGRISIRSDRVGHEELIQFAEGVIDEFSRSSVSTSPFIRTFARPMTLAGVLADLAGRPHDRIQIAKSSAPSAGIASFRSRQATICTVERRTRA